MTLVVLLADPPREGLVLPALPDAAPVSVAEATDLYRAMLRDAARAVGESGGDLLVNYPPADRLEGAGAPEAELRSTLDGIEALDDPRFEVQVGSTPGARVGNAVEHLLETGDHASVAAMHPDAPLVGRSALDSAAMKLRRHEVVLGPASRGRVRYAGFTAPIDFTDAYDAPALDTLTRRAEAAGHSVDFLPYGLKVTAVEDLRSLVALVRARARTGRIVPAATAEWIADVGLDLAVEDGRERLVRTGEATDSP